MSAPAVTREIRGSLPFLLSRPQRVAALLNNWPGARDTLTEILQAVEKVCAARGIDPAEFGQRLDVTVSINVHSRLVIVELAEL